jgi:tetratricopeptide (TPR) repeat protein
MSVSLIYPYRLSQRAGRQRTFYLIWLLLFQLTVGVFVLSEPAVGQDSKPDWQTQVRQYCESRDWASAMRIVDQEIARAPQDTDVWAWRARILTWSGHLAEAEKEYVKILDASPKDPDNWMGLATVLLLEGKTEEALRAIDIAVELDPKRADLHAARARALRAAGKENEARLEFQSALTLDPSSAEARTGLRSPGGEPKHELRFGQDNDLFSFAGANHGEWISLTSRWTPRWSTSLAESFYQRDGVNAGKFVGSVTRRLPKLGAFTVGGADGHDNAVIPKSEAFFDLDHGWKISETKFVRGAESVYGQHWYWYQGSRILALNGTAIVYLPNEWTISLTTIGARSTFSGTGAEWRPSGVTRIGFPLVRRADKGLTGNVFFAAGTENFAQVDQIGEFASQTYGGGLRFQITAHQDVRGYASYQKRTQDKTEKSFGFSYGIFF